MVDFQGIATEHNICIHSSQSTSTLRDGHDMTTHKNTHFNKPLWIFKGIASEHYISRSQLSLTPHSSGRWAHSFLE